ncbi:MAG: hypothetical protein KF862_28270 [Chitinophagaceae bacterium]|nr:hypothetical protein [Chitinophagaceae bacterium]
MKSFLLFTFFRLLSSPPDSLYEINFEAYNGNMVSMSSFKGKSIVIVVLNNKQPGIKYLISVDSLAKKSLSSTVIILVPAADLGADNAKLSKEIGSSADRLSAKKIVIAKEMSVTKKTGEQQHPLFQWLTHAKLNGHFDNDIKGDGQMYMISDKGVLFGVHEVQLSNKTVSRVITQTIRE